MTACLPNDQRIKPYLAHRTPQHIESTLLVLTIGSIATFLAIYFTAFWLFYQIVNDYQGKAKKGNKSLLLWSIFLLFLILGLELVGFVNP